MYKKVFQNHPLHSTKPFWHKLSYLLKKKADTSTKKWIFWSKSQKFKKDKNLMSSLYGI